MEKHLERKIDKYAKSLGLRTAKFVDQSRRGAPDRMIFYPHAVILFMETKVGKNGLSAHQEEYHDTLISEGHDVCSVWTFERAKYEIDRLLNNVKFVYGGEGRGN